MPHTRNTFVGNDFVRGVSGGERKRVSLNEMLTTNAALICWDNCASLSPSVQSFQAVITLTRVNPISHSRPRLSRCAPLPQGPPRALPLDRHVQHRVDLPSFTGDVREVFRSCRGNLRGRDGLFGTSRFSFVSLLPPQLLIPSRLQGRARMLRTFSSSKDGPKSRGRRGLLLCTFRVLRRLMRSL